MTFVDKSLIIDTDGRIEVFGLFKLTYKNERPKSADYLNKIKFFIFYKIYFLLEVELFV